MINGTPTERVLIVQAEKLVDRAEVRRRVNPNTVQFLADEDFAIVDAVTEAFAYGGSQSQREWAEALRVRMFALVEEEDKRKKAKGYV